MGTNTRCRALLGLFPVLALAAALCAPVRAHADSGAIWTTDSGCGGVNINQYSSKPDVYLNGGPQGNGGGLPDGSYWVRVTTPNGDPLGKSAGADAVVSGGKFVQCYQLVDIVYTASSGGAVKGFDDTTNTGGEYKVDVSIDPAFPGGTVKSDNFKVSQQGQPPAGCVIVCPQDITANADDGKCSAALTVTGPDLGGCAAASGASGSRSDGAALTDPYPVGTTTITWTITYTDTTIAPTHCIESVTVLDTQKPSITCPGDQTLEITTGPNSDGLCAVAVPDYTSDVASDNCGSVHVTQEPAPGTPLEIGDHTITLTAVDDAGNSASCTFKVTVATSITATKFYDVNTNGSIDPGEGTIPGWKFVLEDVDGNILATKLTDGSGSCTFHGLGAALYIVVEVMPNGTWMNTFPAGAAPVQQVADVTAGCPASVAFGNVCLGPGGGLTLGFWSNKNGQALVTSADLAVLAGLNLRSASGANFDPTTYSAFRTWILNATATNMAYMLSAQLAAMELNVLHGFVSNSALIYAPGTSSANAAGFATVGDLMTEANTSLGLNGYTVTVGPVRTLQEAMKNALDAANNNRNFVQVTPCPFTYPQ